MAYKEANQMALLIGEQLRWVQGPLLQNNTGTGVPRWEYTAISPMFLCVYIHATVSRLVNYVCHTP